MKKVISLILAAMLLFSAFEGINIVAYATGGYETEPVTIKNGWYQDEDGYWYYYVNDNYVTGWKKLGGKWYYFMTDCGGVMACDEIVTIKGKGYYFNDKGAMQTGWCKLTFDDGYVVWYYADSDGVLYKGWHKISGKWYYFDKTSFEMVNYTTTIDGKLYAFDKNGAMIAGGWGQDSYGSWYYAKDSGVLITGWKQIGSTWYYFDTEDGFMYIGSWGIDGKIYFFSSSGAWVKSPKNGWNSAKVTAYEGSKDVSYTEWCYYKNGKPVTGWLKLSGKWYYFSTTHGHMITGSLCIKDVVYFFNEDGSLRTTAGWYKSYGCWYYIYSDGTCATGWKKLGGKWYYFDPEYGEMLTGVIYDGSDYYYCDSNGALVTKAGWLKIKEDGYTTWFYSDSSGRLAMGWKTIGGKDYYFAPYMYAGGVYEIDGVEYEFDINGALATGMG